jgi:hypothetical protein
MVVFVYRHKFIALPFLFGFLVLLILTLFLATSKLQKGTFIHRPYKQLRHGAALNWSGYAVQTNLSSPLRNVVTDVKGGWTIPALTCGPLGTYSATWVGIDGYSSGTVEQTGIEQDCISGRAFYSAWYELYPWYPHTIRGFTVRPGDKIQAEVSYLGSNRYSLTLINQTTNKGFSTVQRISAQRSSAEWIEEAPSSIFGGVLPLSNFGKVSFTNSQVTLLGHSGTINDSSWQNDPIKMVTTAGVIKALPSVLSSDGSGFDLTWLHQ